MGFTVKTEEVKYGSDVCSVTAGAMKNVQEILKSRHLCEESVTLQDNLVKWPKLHFVLNPLRPSGNYMNHLL
jgi:hypothetical protein